MANIEALAQSAKRRLDNGDAITEADAIRKAIRGSGIFHELDIKRLMKLVGTQFARNKYDERRAVKKRRR